MQMAPGSVIPEALQQFLAAYPHPAFALEAKPLHQALITRASIGQDTSKEDEVAVRVLDEDTNSPVSQLDAADTPLPPSPPLPPLPPPENPALTRISKSLPSSFGSKSSSRRTKTASSTRSGPDQGPGAAPHGLSTNDRILSSAFNAHPSASDDSTGFHPATSSYLSGGGQASHDPSRTAEGAVRSMMQQAETEGRRQQKVTDDATDGRARDQIAADASWGGIARGVGTDAGDTNGESRRERGVGKPLAELLTPAWANDKWRSLVSTGDGEPELGLLALLSRQAAQVLLALLVDAVELCSVEGTRRVGAEENSTFTCTLPLSFPSASIHHPSRAAVADPSTSRGPDPNAYRRSSLLPNSPAQSTLDIVVTHLPSNGFLILTTILHLDNQVATPPPSPPIRPPPSASSNFPKNAPSTINSRSSSTTERSPTRPPLTHQPTNTFSSSNGTGSSTNTIVPASSSGTIPSSTDCVERDPLSPSFDVALPTDRVPVPFPEADETPFSALTSTTADPPTVFPRGFAIEKPRKSRKSKGLTPGRVLGLEEIVEPTAAGGGEQESTREEDDAQGVIERTEIDRIAQESSAESSEIESAESSDLDVVELAPESGVSSHAPRSVIKRMFAVEGAAESDASASGADSPPRLPTPSFSDISSRAPSSSTPIFAPSDDPFFEVLSHTPMGRRIAAYPWETSPLGIIANWSREVRVVVTLMLASPFRCSLWLGPESVLLYNDEYVKVAGQKHPALLGKSGADGWAELWDTLGPLAARVMSGETISYYDHFMPMFRSGFLEETYQMWSFVPFRGANGDIIGYQNFSVETTARVIAEQYCQKTVQSLEGNAFDIPFAMLYTCEVQPQGGGAPTRLSESAATTMSSGQHSSSTASTVKLTLRGSIGVPLGHPSAPATTSFEVDLTAPTLSQESDTSSVTSNSGTNATGHSDGPASTTFPFREAFQRKRPIFIQDLAGRASGYTSRGWPDPPKQAVCIPILVEDDTVSFPRAVLVVGLNPRRPWNEVYATFLHLLSRQIATGLFSVASAEQDFRRAEELLQLDRAKSAFFSNVSHELRTPLTLILGPLQDVLSAKENLQPADRERLTVVQRHSTRLLNMVNSLLDFSRIETGRTSLVFRPVRLSQLTVDLVSLFRSAIERGGVEFIVDAEPDPESGRAVFLSPELWEKVVFNLCGNAFKYTLSGSITCRVRFHPTEAVVEFIDTGCGIADSELSKIFERFHRVENTSRSREGTGIGLALTLELVKALGSLLDVTSQLGHGSTFTGNSKILLVDDNEDLRNYVGSVLRKAFRVVECADGQDALEYCLKSPPDLVVTDIMMPRLDGPGLLAALRDNPLTSTLPIIFLSAKAGPEVKPFQSRELVARVNVHLQLGKLRKELEKRVEERTRALFESEMRYRGLADRYSALSLLSPVGVFLCDAEGVLTYANPQFYAISSFSPDAELANWPDAILAEDRPETMGLWQEAIATTDGVPKLMEFRFAAQQNWVQLELRSFRESSTKRGFVGSVTDITRVKAIEALHLASLQQRAHDAEENTRQKELYIDSVSHDCDPQWQNAELLRESLSSIQSFVEDAAQGDYPPVDELSAILQDVNESVDAVDSIILCALHQGRIVDDVLNVSRLDMNLLTITPTPFDVETRVNEVLKMFDVECSQKRIQLVFEKGPGIQDFHAGWLVADHARVAQILLNFLSNSIKFTADADVKKITVRLDALDVLLPRPTHGIRIPDVEEKTLPSGSVWLVIAVQDSGRGLTEDDLTRLFNRFSQAHPKYGGSGLGLYVSKKLVELHGGFLQVESDLGKGSKFTLSLPVPVASAPSPGLPASPSLPATTRLGVPNSRRSPSRSGSPRLLPAPAAEAPPIRLPSPTRLTPIRVLVVEDNVVNQKVLGRQLKTKGYDATVANNGREALDILLETEKSGPRFDCVLMDVEMPVMGGVEAIQEIRKLEASGELSQRHPVVCVTGNARPAQVQSFREVGFDDICIKPYNFKVMSAIIETLAVR
ncbi:hypothetical protein RQP46_002602 [Phenoliferia psychrophenolica]